MGRGGTMAPRLALDSGSRGPGSSPCRVGREVGGVLRGALTSKFTLMAPLFTKV